MAHTYLRFDFGLDEERAQQARHKLDGWRQAFRLDKRVQYKLDRPEGTAVESAAQPEVAEKPAEVASKSREKPAPKAAAKGTGKSGEAAGTKPDGAANGRVGLLVRLYFSSHEKLSEQRWLQRIPSEEPFKSASPKMIQQGDAEFEATDEQFEASRDEVLRRQF